MISDESLKLSLTFLACKMGLSPLHHLEFSSGEVLRLGGISVSEAPPGGAAGPHAGVEKLVT